MGIVGQDGLRFTRFAAAALLLGGCVLGGPARAGSFDLFGIDTEYKLTLGYATAMRMEKPDPALTTGKVDVQQVVLANPASPCPSFPPNPCIGSFGHTGLPEQTNFDDGNRDFNKGALLNNRVSAYGEVLFKLDNLGLGDTGFVASGAAHHDAVFLKDNDHDNPDSVNRTGVMDTDPPKGHYDRYGPVNQWLKEAEETNGNRHRLLEAYAYGQWYLTDTIGLSVRAGRHLAAWGESLFFPGIVSAQGPFDATKANVPGVEVKEILLPVNQVSMQMSLTSDLTLLAYKQFEFKETEIFPEGDFFSPADLVGPGSNFGYGSINPLSQRWCGDASRVEVHNFDGTPAPNSALCTAANAFDPNTTPDYVYTLRTPDSLPGNKDKKRQYGIGLKYSITPDLNLGLYYIRYNNHNPNVKLNMGYAYIGDFNSTGQPATTQQFNIRVPTSYTVDYANDIEMRALSFSTVFWVFNVGGEVIQRRNVDTSLEADIAGVIAPVGTRGDTTTAQMSLLYVNNPGFLYDEVVVVGEFAYTTVNRVDPRRNEDGICYTGAEANNDCARGKPDSGYVNYGDTLFYDKSSDAMQLLALPKIRNAFSGWDVGTPINFAWLQKGTPSTPGVFGALYGEGDMRVGLGITAQYLQNLELSLGYNAFLGDPGKNIRNSTLRANPYADHDYAYFNVKYNL